MSRPHLEAEPAASGPGAVTQQPGERVVPRTFSSGERGRTRAEEHAVVFSHTYRDSQILTCVYIF